MPDELIAFVAEQSAKGRRGVKACPAVVVARAQLDGAISQQPPPRLSACQSPGGFLERPLETLALLGESSALLKKRVVGLPVRPLRPLEFAAEALDAPYQPLHVLLDALTV